MAEIDLSRLADAYRFRSDDGGNEIAAMLSVCGIGANSHVVDVGGGRGAQAASAKALGARVTVIDPSIAMLHHAAARSIGLGAVQGVGEALPLASSSADLVYFHLSIHHGDWKLMLEEAWRVARPGGYVWVWTMTDDHHRASVLAKWFPRVAALDEARFPKIQAMSEHLAGLGGSLTTIERQESMTRTAADWVKAVEAGYVSTLHLLSDDELAGGLERFRAAHPDLSEVITYQLRYAGVSLQRPPLRS
jgi:ubiquinone/menaquinone biosynthesis C-methylase UbiE